jgi:glycosyltransferase involved in cell wall biosynthesis
MPPAEGGAEEFPCYLVSPVDLRGEMTRPQKLRAAGRILSSLEARRVMKDLIGAERPDIIHFHNIYHQLSPSVISAAAECGIPCVMTLHDYKLTCPIYTHRRRDQICEQCRGRRFANCLRFRCTEGSVARSLLNTVEMYLHHNLMNLYGQLDMCIAPSQFLREKTGELGFSGRVEHLMNFVHPDNWPPRYDWDRSRLAYFGRLSCEKGLLTLLRAMRGIDAELLVIGTGPLKEELQQSAAARGMKNVRFTGYKTGEELTELVSGSMFTVLPSEWYENNPRCVIESFALGTPVVGADIGGIPELVGRERGLCFRPGDVGDLRRCLKIMLGRPGEVRAMGRKARQFAQTRLNPDVYYEGLMRIYRTARSERRAK